RGHREERAVSDEENGVMIVTKKAIARRTILRGMGAAVALPFLDSMMPAFATAAEAKSPRRFGVVYVPNGMVLSNWTPLRPGKDFEFTPTLKALERFRDELTVVSGTDRVAGTHAAGCTSFLTDVAPKPSDGSELLAGVSMDQLIAHHIG